MKTQIESKDIIKENPELIKDSLKIVKSMRPLKSVTRTKSFKPNKNPLSSGTVRARKIVLKIN